MLFKSYNVHHLILLCLLNCCINLISHLQTPLIIFKSCHSLQFITISQSSIHYNQRSSPNCSTNLLYTPVYTLFIITRGFVSLHNLAMNETQHINICLRYIRLLNVAKTRKQKSLKLLSAQTQIDYADRVSRTGAPKY